MTRLNSFYLSPAQWPSAPGETISLDKGEARHMGTVLRTEQEQTVRLFDGVGHDGLFTVAKITRNAAELTAVELNEHEPPASGLTLAIGWGKSKRRDYLFEKTVELQGVGLIFWQASRSQGSPPRDGKETWMDKCIQAAKQCGTPFLPTIETVDNGVNGLIELAPRFDRCLLAWESDEATRPLSPALLSKGRTLVVIGPEGGFDVAEADQLIRAGFAPVTLGRSILRWETAATYCLSLAMFATQDA